MTNREKRTISGNLLEVDIYPVWDDGRRAPEREPKSKASAEAQRHYNQKQAEKKLVRKVNANFGASDYFVTLTCSPENAPQNERGIKRLAVNYLRRIKARREKELDLTRDQLKEARAALETSPGNAFLRESVKRLKKAEKKLREPMRYIYVIERQEYKTGDMAGRANWHVHLFITGGLDSGAMESMWIAGARVNCANYQPDRFGPETAAKYLSKDPQGRKRYCCSRNLKRPTEKVRDGKYTRRQIEKIAAMGENFAKEWWEKKYPGYRFLRAEYRWNEYNANWYITAVMYRTGKPVPVQQNQ